MKTKLLLAICKVTAILLLLPVGVLAQNTATSEAERLREKVRERVEAAKKDPKAYLGVISDKTETGLEIKTESGEIEQISILPDVTAFVRLGKSSTTIKFTDVAIGDFVAAMGFRNGNEVLDATRVLVTTEPEKIERKAFLGIIRGTTRTGFEFEDRKTGAFFTVTPERNALLTEGAGDDRVQIRLSALEEDGEVVVVGTLEDDEITATRIHLILPPEDEIIEEIPSTPTPLLSE